MLVHLSDGAAKIASYILQCYYCPFICMIILFIFMKTNKIFEPKVRHSFYAVIMSVIGMCIADSVCIYFLAWEHPTRIQIFTLAVGYSLRPLVALFTYFINIFYIH